MSVCVHAHKLMFRQLEPSLDYVKSERKTEGEKGEKLTAVSLRLSNTGAKKKTLL